MPLKTGPALKLLLPPRGCLIGGPRGCKMGGPSSSMILVTKALASTVLVASVESFASRVVELAALLIVSWARSSIWW